MDFVADSFCPYLLNRLAWELASKTTKRFLEMVKFLSQNIITHCTINSVFVRIRKNKRSNIDFVSCQSL